jgi:hypothetical protein
MSQWDTLPIPVETPENIQKTITTLKEWIMEEQKYKIVRKYKDDSHPDNNKVIDTGLTIEEAREHCKDPSTHEKGVWFDCFYEED